MNPSPLTRLARRFAGALLLCLGGLQSVAAQQPAADDGRFAPAAERAQQEADKVIKRILLNGTIQRRIGAPPVADPSAAPAPKAAARPPAPPPQAKLPERPNPAAVDTRPPSAQAPAPIPRTATAPTPVVEEAAPPAEPVAAAAVASALPQASTPPQEDEPLIILQEVEPEFPISIVRRQKKGNVVMRFVVQSDGTVAQINVVKTSNPFLNPTAIQALSQWKFQPLSRPQGATVEMGFDLGQQLSETR